MRCPCGLLFKYGQQNTSQLSRCYFSPHDGTQKVYLNFSASIANAKMSYENMNLRRDQSTKYWRQKFVAKVKLIHLSYPYANSFIFSFFLDHFCLQYNVDFDVCRSSLLDGSVFAPFQSGKISVCRNIRKDVYEKDIDPYRSMSLESYNICYKMHYEACSQDACEKSKRKF